jgi:uncharacterized protein YutE (UPF0331/DUF86 family)
MTVDRQLVATRMAKVREQLRHLGRLERIELSEFLAAPIEQHATERELQIAIEACLDIGHHVISREGLRRPTDYRDVFNVLTEVGMLEPTLGHRLEEMASFRNRLVHGYVDIDPSRVYAAAREDLLDIEAFVAAIVQRFGLADG